MKRGDVVLVFYPFASGVGSSRRPALVIQSDSYNSRINNTTVAQITTNLKRGTDRAHVLIDVATPDGQQSGLLHDSLVSCINLATIEQTRVERVIGSLPTSLLLQVDGSLRVSLGL